MHVMVAIDSFWRYPVQTTEFIDLRFHDILEGTYKSGVKNYPIELASQQIAGDFLLAFRELAWTVRRRKPCRKIQVKPSIDPSLPSYRRRPLRILHQDHGTYRRDSSR